MDVKKKVLSKRIVHKMWVMGPMIEWRMEWSIENEEWDEEWNGEGHEE